MAYDTGAGAPDPDDRSIRRRSGLNPSPIRGEDADDGEAADVDSDVNNGGGKLRYSDGDFLRIVDDECRRSIGFGQGDSGELAKVRIKAQEYRQGKIVDLKVLPGRSTAVDTVLGEAIDTAMPDIMEVFFGGDDVVTFEPDGGGDESQAREESDAVARVVFQGNEAFRAFHDTVQDALLNRTGLWHWWWEEDERPIGAIQAQSPEEAAIVAQQLGEQRPWAKASVEQAEDGTISVNFAELRGRVCFKSIPSEDFTISTDAVSLRECAYCAVRDRPRVQDLIERGVDPRLARNLPHSSTRSEQMQHARDESGEDERGEENGIDDLRIVEARTHYLRIDADGDGKVEIWRIETDAAQSTLLAKECVSQVPVAALTPYLSAHRFHGESLADKLFEVMRIKTVLLRMLLDSGYFALNQRFEVSEDAASEFTISDLLNNAPNVPVRSKTGEAVRPLAAGELGFDVFNALEYMSTVAEQRSGVVRNAQGLNPDTLHDTATGAMQLIGAAQKRIRFICRVFAETGIKDLFLGVHQMMREQFTAGHKPPSLKVGSAWKVMQPGEWAEREAVTVHVGVGSGGKEREQAIQTQALEVTEKVIELQGGANGPFVTPQNVYNRLRAFSRALGERDVDLFWSDPSQQQQQPQPGQGGQPPDPEALKAQGEMAIAQQRLAAESQAAQAKAANDLAIARAKLAGEQQLAREKMQAELALERDKAQQTLALQREEMQAEYALKAQGQALGDRSTDLDAAVSALPG